MILCHNCGSFASIRYEDGHYYCSISCFDESHRREANTLIDNRVQAQAARIKELENALKDVCQWTSECATCDGSGKDTFDKQSACRDCGGYGFNPSGDIRQSILDARRVLQVKE